MIKVHEHSIEVTNENDTLFSLLTIPNLLRHLEYYAKHPHEYFEPLESSEVQEVFEKEVQTLYRVLHFGTMTVKDKVTFTNDLAMVTEIEATEDYPASRLTIKIETAGINHSVNLHFIYEEDTVDVPKEDIFLSLRRKAYEQKDRDMVDQIRRRADCLSELS